MALKFQDQDCKSFERAAGMQTYEKILSGLLLSIALGIRDIAASAMNSIRTHTQLNVFGHFDARDRCARSLENFLDAHLNAQGFKGKDCLGPCRLNSRFYAVHSASEF